MRDLTQTLASISDNIDKLDTLKLSFTQPRSEILDKLSSDYYWLTEHRIAANEAWMSVYFNSKANSSAAKEKEADMRVPEMYKIRHLMSSTKLVIDSLRTSISANKQNN